MYLVLVYVYAFKCLHLYVRICIHACKHMYAYISSYINIRIQIYAVDNFSLHDRDSCSFFNLVVIFFHAAQ